MEGLNKSETNTNKGPEVFKFSDEEFKSRLAKETYDLITNGMEAKEAERTALQIVLQQEREKQEKPRHFNLGNKEDYAA